MRNIAETMNTVPTSNFTLKIRIGSICCNLAFKDKGDYERLHHLYSEFLTDQPADITVDLQSTEHYVPDKLGQTLSETVFTHDGTGFRTNSRVIAGQYDLANRFISIIAERSLGDPSAEYHQLNRLITLSYYSGCKAKFGDSKLPSLFVHACGIVRSGMAIVFSGPSESGKTTIAQMCSERYGRVLNDEMVLVSRPDNHYNKILVSGVPIIGGFSRGLNFEAPLSCVLLLKKSHRTQINRINKTDAYLRFLRQVVNPAYIGQTSGREVYSLMADFSAEITKVTPFYELEFTLDKKKFWNTVSEVEDMIRNGVQEQ